MKWGAKITFGMLIVSVLFSTAVLGRNLWMQEKEQMKFEDLRNQISASKERNSLREQHKEQECETTESMTGGERAILPEYEEIVKENPDFAGWISIEGTNIDYPVMQTPWEPEYYLHRNFTGDNSYVGIPFIGSGNMKETKGDLFIYGHNMRNGTMFADLLDYRNWSVWKAQPVIHLDTLWEKREYEIFAAFYATEADWNEKGGLFYDYDKNSKMNRKTYIQELKIKGLYQTDTEPGTDCRLLFLVTCSYQKGDGRFVVIGFCY